MNLIFEVNFAVFAIFASLLISEVMGSVLLLLFWKEAKAKVLEYVVPIWEVTGTFGAFWVVTSDFAYPTLLIPVASLFASVLVIFLILFVVRNTSISFAEFIIKKRWLDDVKLYKTYAFATVLLGLVVLILLSSLVGGQGINLTTGSFSFGAWISNAGSIPFIIGTLVIAVGLAPMFFGLSPMRKIVLPATTAGIIVSAVSYYLMAPILTTTAWIAVPIVLTFFVAALSLNDRLIKLVSNKALFLTLVSVVIFSLQFLIYPNVIGGALPVDSVTTSGPMSSAYLAITAVGGIILSIMLGFYMSVAMKSGREKKVTSSAVTQRRLS